MLSAGGLVMFSDQFAKLWLTMQHDYEAYMAAQLEPDLTIVQLNTLELILDMERGEIFRFDRAFGNLTGCDFYAC